ncbi:aspartate-semialdehyde dehydrogenase [Buchnera aphidicola (Ceratoglyphina bambusae)]|uniref:aspartate-semialdehyde dehydrogenase n=1 Tax=Buchnera aphidicola TaxID=9 RepID=UPI0031B84675
MKKKVGFIGWRGLVGSVLLERMIFKNDLSKINIKFFTTSQVGHNGPKINNKKFGILENAYDLHKLIELDIILTCQGSTYTEKVYFNLRKLGWKGFWIDASSCLRTNKNSIIVLDPVNYNFIIESINNGCKTFSGGNCTVSLMLMALGGLFSENLIKKIFVSTYQAASGAGSNYIKKLLLEMGILHNSVEKEINKNNFSILKIENVVSSLLKSKKFLRRFNDVPLAGNLIPWIDNDNGDGNSKEEIKGEFETNKILNLKFLDKVIIDSICVRVSTFRCHSQSFLIELKKNIFIKEVKEILCNHNKWIKLIDNTKSDTIANLTPSMVSGTLKILLGRIKKSNFGNKYITAFSIGDQLLWGASEPLRRILNILIKL